MNLNRRIKKIFCKTLVFIRRLFIKEKPRYVSAKMLNNLNLNFKNLSPYSEINVYKTIFILFFTTVFFVLLLYFSYLDIRKNLVQNSVLVETKPMQIVVENPLIFDNAIDTEYITYNIKKNDTLSDILTKEIKLSKQEANKCINVLRQKYNLNNLQIGQKLEFKVKNTLQKDEGNNFQTVNLLEELKVMDDNIFKTITVYKNNGDFVAEVNDIKQITLYNRYFVFIQDGLYTDSVKAGIPAEIIMTLINYYSFDIDFQRDLQPKDTMEVVFEAKYTETGKKIKNGDIVFANLHTNKRDYNLYRYVKNNKFVGYFDQDGLSTQKSLLKTPIDGARISSGFSLKRRHPVLGYTTAHRGIDFAAPMGTPYYAAGSGKIVKVLDNCREGNKRCGGGFGNFIQIKHNDSYTTEYAHSSRIAKNIREGIYVKQGDIIGYVGNTGLSTGPHLHYGIIYKGQRINPAKVKTMPTIRLKGQELISFLEERDKINLLRSTALNQNSSL